MNKAFFNPDRDLEWYKIDTPYNLISGMSQIDRKPERYATRHRVPQKAVVGGDKCNKKRNQSK